MVLQPADLPRTKVFILKGKGTHYDDTTKLSDYSKYDAMAEVTEGKPWGASLAEYQRQRT